MQIAFQLTELFQIEIDAVIYTDHFFLHWNMDQTVYCLLCWGLTTRQPLWVILCRLPEKGRKETEEIVEEMKERDREEREIGMKVKNKKK